MTKKDTNNNFKKIDNEDKIKYSMNSKNRQKNNKGLGSSKPAFGLKKGEKNSNKKQKDNNLNDNFEINKTEIVSEKQKQEDISGKTDMAFKDAKIQSKSIVAILLIFVLSVFAIGSVIVAGNFSNGVTVTANATNTRIVQAKLSSLGYFDDEIDGVYDQATIDAIKNYQADKNLPQTGTLDSATTTALGVTDNAQANSDLYLLAKLIYSEARGEIYQGQVAVGAVVLNRVADAGFPNTLQGVIYQPWAFTALHDGQFSLEPNSTAYSAAQDAMNGWDPTYGCLYYYNPRTATSSWIFSRQIAVTIGNHVFCY